MATKFATGKNSISECDRCSFRYPLKVLRKLTIKTKQVSIKVCPECWEMDHPQLQLGLYPVFDPQAVREPRPDTSYYQSGLNINGLPADGSRITQWGWQPVGGSSGFDAALTENYLVAKTYVGTVTVSIT